MQVQKPFHVRGVRKLASTSRNAETLFARNHSQALRDFSGLTGSSRACVLTPLPFSLVWLLLSGG
jgi:hypothetical protein